MKSKEAAEKEVVIKVLCENRKARFDYHILEKYEAGIVLTGAEIKSARSNGMSIQEGFARFNGDELFLINAHIRAYSHSADLTYDPVRSRKLLLHRDELRKLQSRVEQKGLTIVPLKVYLKNGLAKLELGLAKGKNAPDRRDAVRDRDAKREIARSIKRG